MRILGIETSCDETGIAVYDSEKGLLANELFSQIKLIEKSLGRTKSPKNYPRIFSAYQGSNKY